MFNRKAYKQIAMKELYGRRATSIFAMVMSSLIMLIISLPYLYSNFLDQLYPQRIDQANAILDSISPQSFTLDQMLYVFGIDLHPLAVISFLLPLFIMPALSMAKCYTFIAYSHTTQKLPKSTYIKGFAYSFKAFRAALLRSVMIYLWSCLLWIPGITKSYAYSQMMYIIAENPKIKISRAISLSNTLTKGFKWNLFVLDLSFIGWRILGLLSFGIANLWINPYIQMTKVNAFHSMKSQKLLSGDMKEEDFTGIQPQQTVPEIESAPQNQQTTGDEE